ELTEEAFARVQAFAERVPAIELGDGTVLSDLLAAPVVPVPSEDGRAALVTVVLDGERANEQVGEERVVTLTVEQLRAAAQDDLAGDGLEVWVTGPAGFVTDLVEAFAGIDGILLVVALSVVLLILVLVYRSPVLPF